MGIFKTGLWLAAAGVSGVAYMGAGETLPREEMVSAEFKESPTRRIAERFRVVLSGRDTGCDVRRGDSLSERKARLVFGAGCVTELPALAQVKYWSEDEDGSVAFTAEDGKVAVRFAAGDGHAFESFGAGAPLISLIAADD